MEEQQLEEVIACLPKERTLFTYYKDQYAVYLLKQYLNRAASNDIHSVKQSRVKKLLDKPVVKDSLKMFGNGLLDISQLESLVPDSTETYVLTLGKWGHKNRYDWNQTSRPGMNLVLQLNLSQQMDVLFKQLTGCELNRMTTSFHPKSRKRSATLAWARLDMDFTTGEVLIEEIQSDLIRDMESIRKRAANPSLTNMWLHRSATRVNREQMLSFCEAFVSAQKKLWSEAMMAATLWFVQQELGFSKVYYHSFETGKVMKKIKLTAPPRSLYTDLPEKFCFQSTTEAPEFIAKDAKAKRRLNAVKKPEWFLMVG